MITVFTPTYNRAHLLGTLFDSLEGQTDKDFEWLVVDDGSTDDTAGLIGSWAESAGFPVRYVRQDNGGKHRAINRGIKEAGGELFFIVDSDDYLTPDAIENIDREWQAVDDKSNMAGLCFRKVNYSTGEILGAPFPPGCRDADSLTIHYGWGIRADKAEVFRTDVLRRFPFPEIEGEKFVTEAVVWNRIADSRENLLRCVDRGIYMCDYLPVGLTANFNRLIRNNPKGFILYYKSLLGRSAVWRHPLDVAKAAVRLAQSYFHNIVKCTG